MPESYEIWFGARWAGPAPGVRAVAGLLSRGVQEVTPLQVVASGGWSPLEVALLWALFVALMLV